jgi:hypothetical protein
VSRSGNGYPRKTRSRRRPVHATDRAARGCRADLYWGDDVSGQRAPCPFLGIEAFADLPYACYTLARLAIDVLCLAYLRALQLGPASRVAPIDKLSLPLTVLLAALLLGEIVGWKVWVGVLLMSAGALPLPRERGQLASKHLHPCHALLDLHLGQMLLLARHVDRALG